MLVSYLRLFAIRIVGVSSAETDVGAVLAMFAYEDHAKAWAQANYPNRYRIEAVLLDYEAFVKAGKL